MTNFERVFGNTGELASDSYSALKGADCAIVMTEWEEFKSLRPKDYLGHIRTPNVVDARRIHTPEKFREINLVGIGLAPVQFSTDN